ncbi:hypothetical protein GGX14DRAFT_483694 [Mycena pura]|uniref:Uncharacterized protein n=1 Tax=Mycena pura TaxID=153505 RepID=A0AAD6UTV2_9AGAR|nr:hypothetical protein GGX14DRAFT_483694 [Mycena pura]
MQLTSVLSTLLPFLLAAVAGASPAPAGPKALDVFVPKITYPTEGVVLTSNATVKITWDTTGAPVNISNQALLLLGKTGRILPFILAKDFDLRSGSLQIAVPYVLTGEDYFFVCKR